MTQQLDLFGTAAPASARRPAKADTALLLAMSADHTTAGTAPPFTKQRDIDSDEGRALIERAMAISAGLSWPQPNAHGVYEPGETLSLPRQVKGWQGGNLADIEIINLGRYWLWAASYQLHGGDWRGSAAPLKDGAAYRQPTRAGAIAAAATCLRQLLEDHDNADARRIIAWLDGL